VAVAFGAQAAQGKADVFVAVSRDGGRRFSDPVRVNRVDGDARLGGELPPRVALIARAGADPDIVVAYGAKTTGTEILVTRSTDGGRTFPPAKPVQATGAPGDRGWHAMTLDAQGAAHVMWLDHRGLAPPPGTTKAASGSHQHAGMAEKEAIDGLAMAMRSGLYYAREGAAAAAERELVKGVCYCCKVALSVTPGGGLVAAWRQVYAGNIRDIAFITSADGGRTFSAPGRVSADEWNLAGCPDDGPALAVDAQGTSHVVWPTVLAGPTPEGAIFYASSVDGRQFTARTRVPTLGSPRPMHPQIFMATNDRGYVAWDEVIDGVRQAAIRPIHLHAGQPPSFGDVLRLGTKDTPTSYPMIVSTPASAVAVFVEGKPGASAIRVTPVAP
jgi:hypothetical protein